MATASASDPNLECPVCHEDFESDISSLGHLTMTSQTAAGPKSSQTASSQSTSSQPTSSQTASSQPTSSQNVRVTVPSSQPGPKPRGAELARVLKVGDIVKLVSTCRCNFPGLRPDHQGRVTAIRSCGWVDVRWDDEGEDRGHLMGDDGIYELDLV